MNIDLIHKYLADPNDDNTQSLLDAEDTVFWVDWREEDDVIVEYCESILKTGHLKGAFVDIEDDPGFRLEIEYGGNCTIVPLVMGPEDRHITLCTLNSVIGNDFEIRFCIASQGGDTLAFLPLPHSVWGELETNYPEALAASFGKLTAEPNLFTQGWGYQAAPTWQSLAADPATKSAAIKAYRDEHSCGLGEAKVAVESYIAAQ